MVSFEAAVAVSKGVEMNMCNWVSLLSAILTVMSLYSYIVTFKKRNTLLYNCITIITIIASYHSSIIM
jgi:hypothetical protein